MQALSSVEAVNDSGLALDAKLHGTYDNGGPMCCKHIAM